MHDWINYPVSSLEDLKGVVVKHKCITCKCVRKAIFCRIDGEDATTYKYERSGLDLNDDPGCLNWDEENNKTID